MHEETKQPIQERVLSAIKAGTVKMRPRWQFVLMAALAVLGAIVLSLTLVYLVSFTLFSSFQSGAWFAPAFGLRGVGLCLRSLPWLLILLTIAFIVILEVLVRRYAFAYRRPLLYSALGVVALAAAGGFALSQTPLHARLYERAEAHRLPVGGQIYRQYGERRVEGLHPGVVVEPMAQGFLMTARRDETLTVRYLPGAVLVPSEHFQAGDAVIVIGDRDGSEIRAYGVRKIDGRRMIFRGPPPPLSR